MTTLHELKTDPEPFKAVWSTRKLFDIRRDDRDFRVGDVLHLQELQNTIEQPPDKPRFTGRSILVLVIHLLRGPAYGLAADHVCMSIKLLTRLDGGMPCG